MPECPGQPGGGPPGQFQPEPGQHAQQRDAAPPVPLAQPHAALGLDQQLDLSPISADILCMSAIGRVWSVTWYVYAMVYA